MGKSNTQQTSYIAGEVSPLIRGRPDIVKYGAGAETVENFIVRPQGPLWRRGGTQYIARGTNHTTAVSYLFPFLFSSTEAYLLEFANLRIRIRDQSGAAITTGAVFTISSVADFGDGTADVTLSAAHGLAGTVHVTVTGSTVHTYNGEWLASVTGGAKLHLLSSVYSATATGSLQHIVGLTSPYPTAVLDELSFAQSADTFFICHKNYKPRKLTRSSAASWTLAEFTAVDGPYLDYDKTDTRLTVSGIVDVSTMLGNAALVDANPFAAGDVNKHIEYFDDGEWYKALVKTFVSTSEVTVDITDNVLVGMHPSTRLGPPTSDGTKSSSRQKLLDFYGAKPTTQRPQDATSGISPKNSPAVARNKALDRAAKLTLTGTELVATHSNTFELSDLGKWVRIIMDTGGGGSDPWRTIASFTNSFTVEVNAAVAWKTYSYASGEYVTLKQGSRSITATLTASAATFASTDVGRHIRMNFQGRWVYAKITVYTSTTVVTIQMFESFPRHLRDSKKLANDGNTDIWRFGAWFGADGTGTYPSQVTFHEQRLVFAGSPAEPQTLWFSRPQDFDKMSPSEPDGSVLDDNAINVTLASNRVNTIMWLQSAKVLLVGTIGGEWQGRAATSITEPITPTNIAFTEETTHGSIDASQPLKVGSAVLFLQRSGQKLVEMTYNFELDGWASRDLTIASEHIMRKATKGLKLAHQNEPHGIVWVVTSSGDLIGMTYKREQEVIGWHYHRIGGSGIVESICTIPSSDGSQDNVFLVVRRTINGSTVRYIEKFTPDDYPDSSTDKNGFFYVDSMVTQTQTGTGSTWTYFPHLIGSTVTVLKNGVTQGTFVVNASGAVTGLSFVNNDALTGGLAYTSKFKSLPIQGGSPYGSSDMTTKRVARLFLRVYNSISAKIGRSESALVSHIFSGTAVGSETLYTGDYGRETNLDYSSDGVFHIQVTDPYPLILLGTVAQLVANE